MDSTFEMITHFFLSSSSYTVYLVMDNIKILNSYKKLLVPRLVNALKINFIAEDFLYEIHDEIHKFYIVSYSLGIPSEISQDPHK